MKIDFFAREKHHIEHAQAIYNKLPEEIKGDFLTDAKDLDKTENEVVACFCYGDLKKADEAGKKIIYSEHGIGMYYNTEHPSYAGSLTHRKNVILRLVPNQLAYDKEKESLECPIEIIGVPKMDKYFHLRSKPLRIKRTPTIAISFHWDCLVCPETRSSFRYYLKSFPFLSSEFNVIGHGHPRIFGQLYDLYRHNGIRPVEDFDTVIREADIYICDNSSTIFEFAYTKKPVILLNNPSYRRDIEHKGNPRFWKNADIGLQVDDAVSLVSAIHTALTEYEESGCSDRQEEITKEMFHFVDGKCSERAANIIYNFIKEYGE